MELALSVIGVVLIPMIGAILSFFRSQKADRKRMYERMERTEEKLNKVSIELEKHLLVHKVKLDK